MTGAESRGGTLVVQTGYLGDVVLTTPLLTALAERHGRVDIVTTPAARALVETHPAVRRAIPFAKRGTDRGIAGGWRLARALRSHRYARAYLPHDSWRSAALAVAARIPERVGFAGGGGGRLYTRRVVRSGEHECERLAALAALPVGSPVPPLSLGLTAADRAEADRWLQERRVEPNYVAVAPGSVWATKRWPYYAELAARIRRPIVVIGGPAERALGATVAAAAPGRAWNAAGSLGIRASAVLIERATLLVANDSAPLHLASAVGTPAVALFGPTVPAFGFGSRGASDIALGRDELPCRPCSRHGGDACPLGHHHCMRELGVETVADAVHSLASNTEARRALCRRH